MTTRLAEAIRKRVGWCPNADAMRSSWLTTPETALENARKGWRPEKGPDPASDGDHGDVRSEYRENMLLILIAAAWLFPVVYQREFLPILLILSAVAVYYDAQDIHAGQKFEKERLFGDIVAWQPLTWGAATFVGGIIIMVIYLFHRREIFNANRGTACS
jgi:hypothetical protein